MYMKEKFKSALQNDRIFFSVLIIFVAAISFLLGRQSVSLNSVLSTNTETATVIYQEKQANINLTPTHVPLTSTATPVQVSEVTEQDSQTVAVVASRNGTRYHLPECPGAARIKPENLLTFPSRAAAEAAGYTPAVNCPGLR